MAPTWIIVLSLLDVASGTKNVLFLMVDDMRADLGAYTVHDPPTFAHTPIHTPHLDNLAASSLLLTRTYVQYPLCNPSRASLMTGRRPSTLKVYDLTTDFHDTSSVRSMPEFFKDNGYHSVGIGKIYHKAYMDLQSWSEPVYEGAKYRTDLSWAAVSNSSTFQDRLIASRAIDRLHALAPDALDGEQPFFMAVGFHRPHTPLVYPAEFNRHYPAPSIQLAHTRTVPEGFPPVAWNRECTLCKRRAQGVDPNVCVQFNNTMHDATAIEIRRAYYSCISFIDDQIGRVLNALDDLGLRNNTIVTFISDHGFHLGEHNQWCKRTMFEESTRVPAMIRVPGLTDGGIISSKLTEAVDIFPTVVEAAGLDPVPLCPVHSSATAYCREGASWMRLVENPARSDWKQRVYSQIDRFDQATVMGLTVRTEDFRYTEWLPFILSENRPNWLNKQGVELYDLRLDPSETINVVNDATYATNVSSMASFLRRGWSASSRDMTSSQPHSTIWYLKYLVLCFSFLAWKI